MLYQRKFIREQNVKNAYKKLVILQKKVNLDGLEETRQKKEENIRH